MKKLYIYLLMLCVISCQATYYHAELGDKSETIKEAKERFTCMTARQMHTVDVRQFTPNQQEAFKELAIDYFTTEIACPDCSSQANRRKYEIMYQKIGQLDYGCKAG